MTDKPTMLRILIVEDSPVIGLALEDMVRGFGHSPLGPAGNMALALESVESDEMDAAIIDLNVRGTKTFSLMSVLDRCGIPFLIISGYADWKMPSEWSDRIRLQKPFNEAQLQEKLSQILPIA